MAKNLTKAGEAILGGFVADAATLPLHWHYKVGEMKDLIKKHEKLKNPEFFTPVSTQYYTASDFPGHYNLGQLSCYSEQSVMMLEYFESTEGKFLGGESFAKFMYDWFKKYDGRQDHPTKDFLKQAEDLIKANKPLFPDAGADDGQTMHTFKIPVIAMKLLEGDEKEYFKAIDEASLAHQNKDIISRFAKAYGIILKEISAGKGLKLTLEAMVNGKLSVHEEVSTAIAFTLSKVSKPKFDKDGWDNSNVEFASELSNWLFEKYGGNPDYKSMVGLTCGFPGSFMASLKVVLDTLEEFPEAEKFKNEGFAFAVRRNILFGGDNCGRTFVIGPLVVNLGAEIPTSFLDNMNQEDLKKYINLIDKVSKL